MIKLDNVRLQIGSEPLLNQASMTVHAGQRVGLVGSNGVGKSSLFKLLMRQYSVDEGELQCPAQWRIAHMAQEVSRVERTALDYVLDGDQPLRPAPQQIQQAEQAGCGDALAQAYAQLEAADGYTAAARAQQLLSGLGFSGSQHQQPVGDFSGGWRIRLNLAQALMCPSDLLLLDEPTNHLDLDAIVWFEQWLLQYAGTLIVISHDRDFLDTVVQHIVHIEQQQLVSYSGHYSAFEQQRAARLVQQQAQYDKQQRQIQHINQFVTRFKAKASKAKQAQSRLKALQRMQQLAPAYLDSPFQFSFAEPPKQSDPLVQLIQADLGYTSSGPLLQQVNLNLHPGSRLALLGLNGAGKSTLIKALAGEAVLLRGERLCGRHCYMAYYAQHQLEALDLNASALLHLQRLRPGASEQQIRDFLGGFDFVGDKALCAIAPFSGGEKARLALALVVWQAPNVLLLDEPTNHLDMPMRYALTWALQQFSGALVLISHDRHLLRHTVDDFYAVADGRLHALPGGLDAYHALHAQSKSTQPGRQASPANQPDRAQPQPPAAKKARRRELAQQRQKYQPLRQEIKTIERHLQQVQQQLQQLEQQLLDERLYQPEQKAHLQQVLQQQRQYQLQQENLESQWLQTQQQLDEYSGVDE